LASSPAKDATLAIIGRTDEEISSFFALLDLLIKKGRIIELNFYLSKSKWFLLNDSLLS
jgi:hypothetical protein